MLRRRLGNILALCAGIALALAIGEGLARLLQPVSTVQYVMDVDIGPILVPQQVSRWVTQDYDVAIFTNSAGFHDVEHALDKPLGVYRILVLGDSYIEALQLPIEEGFTQQLQRRLTSTLRGMRVEVIGMGVSGLGPSQYYRILDKRGLAYKPDLVIMAVLPDNDFRDSYQKLSGAVFKPYYLIQADGTLSYVPPVVSGFGSDLRPILRRSAFLHLIRQAIASLPVETWLAKTGLLAPSAAKKQNFGKATIPEDWNVYAANLPEPWPEAYRVTLRMIKEANDLVEGQGGKFLVMLIASTQMVEQRWDEALAGYEGVKTVTWDFERPFREIRALAQQSGFLVIDLLHPFQEDFRTSRESHSWLHDGHWNRRGHAVAAEVVKDFLIQHRAEYNLN